MNVIIFINVVLFTFSFIATTLLTRVLITRLSYLGVVDIPDKRRSHSKIVPRGGGLAIVLVAIISLYIFELWTTETTFISEKFVPLLFAIAAISFLDDLRSLPIVIRLLVHLICSSFAVYFFLPFTLFGDHGLSLYLGFALFTVALTGFINIYNFMDGIDGISCIESIHLSATMLMLCYLKFFEIDNTYFIVTLNVIILGCSCGFLIFNWHPAKIFLGDVGSISLGFLTGLCLLLLAVTNTSLFIACFIASLYYVTDAVLTILIRLINKEKIWQPHLKHFFQKAVKKGKSHKRVVSIIAICNVFLMSLSILSLYSPIIAIILAIVVITLTVQNLLR